MKKYIVISFLFMAVKFFPQQNTLPTEPPQTNNPPVQMQQQPVQQNITTYNNTAMKNNLKAEKFKNLKIGGIVLLSAGSIGFISGIALISNAASNQISTTSNQTTTTTYGTSQPAQPITPANESKIVGGAYLIVLGVFAIAGGTVMAAIGSHKQKKYTAASRLSVFVAPTAFRIAYKF